MTFRRILIIMIVLLVLIGLLFGASWYIGRRTAVKNGTEPLTFRQFLGIGTVTTPGQNAQGELVSEFTQPLDSTNGGNSDSNQNGRMDREDLFLNSEGRKTDIFNNTIKTKVDLGSLVFSNYKDTNNNSKNDWNEDVDNNGEIDGLEDVNKDGTIDGYDGGGFPGGSGNGGNPDGSGLSDGENGADNGGFTTGPLTPTDNFPGGGIGDGSDNGGFGNGGTGNGGGLTDNGLDNPIAAPIDTGSTTAPVANSCSEADTNISFTAGEIARLNTLRARFDTIAETIYDDNAANEQLSFYSSFKIKELQTAELMNYCRAKLPYISDPDMKRLVPTPFYHDLSLDANTFTHNPISTSDDNSNSKGYRPIFDHPITATTFLERVLRIDIW